MPAVLGNLQDPALLDDPYPTYHRLLAAGPVLWDEEHGMWIVSGHAEVLEALRRPETSVATAAARIRASLGERAVRFEPLIAAIGHFLTRVDPPDHTRLRALVQKAFTLALGSLVTRFPRLALDPDAPPRRNRNFSLRGFASLPVRF